MHRFPSVETGVDTHVAASKRTTLVIMAAESPYQKTANEIILKNRRFAKSALWNLTFFSIFMMLGPVTAYFASKNYYEAEWDGFFEGVHPEQVGAVVAILTVHVVLGSFIYVAWNEEMDEGDAPMKGWIHPEIQKKLDELDAVHKMEFERKAKMKGSLEQVGESESENEDAEGCYDKGDRDAL
eukprot:CFRG4254T1